MPIILEDLHNPYMLYVLKPDLTWFILLDILSASCFFEFLVYFLFCFLALNSPQALCINPGCLKCISGMNLSLVNKNLMIILFIFIPLKQNISQLWSYSKEFWQLSQQSACLSLFEKSFSCCALQDFIKALIYHYQLLIFLDFYSLYYFLHFKKYDNTTS